GVSEVGRADDRRPQLLDAVRERVERAVRIAPLRVNRDQCDLAIHARRAYHARPPRGESTGSTATAASARPRTGTRRSTAATEALARPRSCASPGPAARPPPARAAPGAPAPPRAPPPPTRGSRPAARQTSGTAET